MIITHANIIIIVVVITIFSTTGIRFFHYSDVIMAAVAS